MVLNYSLGCGADERINDLAIIRVLKCRVCLAYQVTLFLAAHPFPENGFDKGSKQFSGKNQFSLT